VQALANIACSQLFDAGAGGVEVVVFLGQGRWQRECIVRASEGRCLPVRSLRSTATELGCEIETDFAVEVTTTMGTGVQLTAEGTLIYPERFLPAR
tara:strand:+ start:73 stop:360 length:288 start_codon:yes stop_codon:yes gene_type:complete